MGKTKTPGVLPKRKPKATATSTNRKTGATRGVGDADDMDYMRKAAAANMMYGGKVKKMAVGGSVSDAEAVGRTTTEITSSLMDAMRELEKSGKTLKPKRPKNLMPTPEQKKKMKDKKFIRDGIRMYEDGGEVRGMGRAYQGKPRSCKVR